jgi:hypothetical protein
VGLPPTEPIRYPCPTLRVQPCGCPRMARGQNGSLVPLCTTLSFATPSRLARHYRDFHPGKLAVLSAAPLFASRRPLKEMGRSLAADGTRRSGAFPRTQAASLFARRSPQPRCCRPTRIPESSVESTRPNDACGRFRSQVPVLAKQIHPAIKDQAAFACQHCINYSCRRQQAMGNLVVALEPRRTDATPVKQKLRFGHAK